MKQIHDEALLDYYIRQYNSPQFFSLWPKYQPQLIRYEKGEELCSESKTLKNLLFLVDGEIKIYTGSPDGKFLFLDTSTGFKMLGDIEYLEELPKDSPLTIIADALTDVLCVGISLTEYRPLLEKDLLFNQYLSRTLLGKLKYLSRQSHVERLYRMDVRVAFFLLTVEQQGILSTNWGHAHTKGNHNYGAATDCQPDGQCDL